MIQDGFTKKELEEIELYRVALQRGLYDLKLHTNFVFKFVYKKPFLANWHYNLIDEILNAVLKKEVEKVIINMPPSHGKTEKTRLMTSLAIILDPYFSMGYYSYSADLSVQFSLLVREVITSPAVALLTNNSIKINRGRNKGEDWATVQNGGVMASGIGGVSTGRHFNGMVLDDPLKAIDYNSIAKKKSVVDFYEGTLLTRARNPNFYPRIIIGQRLARDDLTGHLLQNEGEGDGKNGWLHIKIKGIEEVNKIYEFGNFKIERKAGDILFPAKENANVLEEKKRTMGHKFAEQYQQEPFERQAGYFLEEDFKFTDEAHGKLTIWIDTAKTTTVLSDETALTVISTTKKNKVQNWYIFESVAGKFNEVERFNELKKLLIRFNIYKIFIEEENRENERSRRIKEFMRSENDERRLRGEKPFLSRVIGYTPSKTNKAERIASNLTEVQNGQILMVNGCKGCKNLIEQFTSFNPEKQNNLDDRINTVSDSILRDDLITPTKYIQGEIENNDNLESGLNFWSV